MDVSQYTEKLKETAKRNRTATIAAAVVLVLFFAVILYNGVIKSYIEKNRLTVGFIYDNESTTPYSYNFYLAQEAIQKKYSGRIRVMMYSNVEENSLSDRMEELARNGCDIIFTNGYGDIRGLAAEYKDIQFCQASNDPYPDDEAADNYHTFKGEVYQGRYASGVVAGIKLKEMIDSGEISPEQAKIGFVAAFPYTEVISGYTAFLLGARSVVPQTKMSVRYTGSWDNFTQEKARANQLLNEGCLVISQHTDTVAPAIACEEFLDHNVYHVGYNIDMSDVAPRSSLVSTRINWEPYIEGAVEAMIKGKKIEDVVTGKVHPKNDMSAGFDENWVELAGLNEDILPEGTAEEVEKVIAGLTDGSVQVFKGDYSGTDPDDGSTVDLKNGYTENGDSSVPSFGFILRDVITEE